MGSYGSKDVGFVQVGGYDMLAQTLGLDDAGIEESTDEVTPLGDSWPKIFDTRSAKPLELKLDALYDDATDLARDVFVSQHGTSRVVAWNVEGNAVGKGFNGYAGAIEQKVQRVASDGKLHRVVATFAGAGPHEIGSVLHPFQEETTASGNTQSTSEDWSTHVKARKTPVTSSSVANPSVITTSAAHGLTSGDKVVIAGHTGSTPSINAEYTATVISTTTFSIPVNVTVGGTGGTVTQASTTGGAGYFSCSKLTLGGYTNFQVKVRHSVDNSTFADLVTFTAITAQAKAERIEVTGAVNRYLASSWAFTGSGSGQKATFFVGFARGAQQ